VGCGVRYPQRYVKQAACPLFVPPADPDGTIVVDAALVDGKSGNIVWANSGGDFKMALIGPAFDKAVLDGVVKSVFATLLNGRELPFA
jgi:hypothetical protein